MAVIPLARQARPRRWSGVLAWALWALAMLGLAVAAWLDYLQRQAGSPETAWLLQPGSVPLGVAAVSAATVGALVGSRRPAHPVGWLLLGLGLLVVANVVASGYVNYGLLARPGALPAAGYLAGITNGIQVLWLACGGFVLLLTPTGSLPSPRWRWLARVAVAAPGSLVVRFRRARGVERQQLRWLAVAAALGAVALLVAVAGVVLAKPSAVLGALGTCVALLPLATGAAILRYRLYDLDRIVSRTLAYSLLTVLLGGSYAGVVLGLGQLLGRDSPLVVATATLAVAAAFQPARRHIQQAVDRRFNRRRYDAARTIAAFSARLRQQVDLDTLTAELLGVVEQTMQPASVSLWLRPSVSPPQDHSTTGASRAASPPTAVSPSVRTGL